MTLQPNPTKNSIAVIILNWNGKENTVRCIESILSLESGFQDLIIVDNYSSDHSYEFLLEKYPQLILLQTHVNLGFAGGMNFGLRKSIELGYRYAILLNNDTQLLTRGTISAYQTIFDKYPNVGGISATIVNDLSGLQRQREIISDSKGVARWFYRVIAPPYPINSSPIEKDENTGIIFRRVPMLHGVALGIRLGIFKTGSFFNETFFCYEEDRDLLIRIQKSGYSLISLENYRIYHQWSGTSVKNSDFVIYYRTRNLWYMRHKYYSYRYIIFAFLRLAGVSIKNHRFKVFIRGLADAIRGYTGNSFQIKDGTEKST